MIDDLSTFLLITCQGPRRALVPNSNLSELIVAVGTRTERTDLSSATYVIKHSLLNGIFSDTCRHTLSFEIPMFVTLVESLSRGNTLSIATKKKLIPMILITKHNTDRFLLSFKPFLASNM